MILPLRYMGEGEFRTTTRGFAAQCDKTLVIGEVLRWETVTDRSVVNHRHYFACIAEAWGNLPDGMADELPSPEHLRKWALVKAGYCKTVKIVCASHDAAALLFIAAKDMDTFSVVGVSERVVTISRATSQNMRAMDKKTFQESKDRVLQVISELIGTDAATGDGEDRAHPQEAPWDYQPQAPVWEHQVSEESIRGGCGEMSVIVRSHDDKAVSLGGLKDVLKTMRWADLEEFADGIEVWRSAGSEKGTKRRITAEQIMDWARDS